MKELEEDNSSTRLIPSILISPSTAWWDRRYQCEVCRCL